MKINVMGVEFDNLTKAEFVQRAERMLQQKQKGYCVTPNAEIVYEAVQDSSFRELLNGAALVLPDGAGVVLGAKILGTPIQEKVAGIEFGDAVCGLLAKNGGRLYLLGGKPGIAEQAAEKLVQKHPGLVVCGTADGYFKEEGPVIAKVNEARPDVVFVCLGAPKQERWMACYGSQTGARLLLGLGGSLDVFAGTVERAPELWRKLNLEWLYRLVKEPKRWKRMARLPLVLLYALGERLRGD